MKFPSKKGFVVKLVIVLLFVLLVFTGFEKPFVSIKYSFNIAQLILLLAITYFVWMWFDTWYSITGTQLQYHCAFINGFIGIDTIHEVIKNKKFYSGLKPALNNEGIIVKYNRWDDIYLSPDDMDGFINALKKINPEIKIIE